MSSFRVQLDDPNVGQQPAARPPKLSFDRVSQSTPRSRRVFIIVGSVAAFIVLAIVVAGFLYYQSFKDTPQYSLALLVDAAGRDDKAEIDRLVDIDAVVEDFVPQVTGKAIELYGRGQPPAVLAKVERLAAPIMPAVKDRARAELPRVIRDRSERFGYVPFFAMVMGADRYLEIIITGDMAVVKSRVPEHPLEMTMRRSGDRWQIVGVREEQLATDIAQKIGQEVIAIATGGLNKKTAETLGVGNVADVLRQAEELVR